MPRKPWGQTILIGILSAGSAWAQQKAETPAAEAGSKASVADVAPAGGPLQKAASADGAYQLVIQPGSRGSAKEERQVSDNKADAKERRGRARATLKGRDGQTLWEGPLLNEIAPAQAFVQNQARFVVTLDDFERGGSAHAVVVYGPRGQKMLDLRLKQVLAASDWKHVQRDKKSLQWLEGATSAFNAEGDEFVIRLAWGTQVTIELKRGRVARVNAAGEAEEAGEMPDDVSELLGDGSADPAVAEFMRRASKILTLIQYAQISKGGLPPELAAAVSALQTQLLFGEGVSPEELAGLTQQLQNVVELATSAGVKLPGENGPGVDAEYVGPPAGNSAAANLAVPSPDPANRVNYMQWLASQAHTDGPSAAEMFLSIVERNKDNPNAGLSDEVDFDKVLAGDAEALNSPQFLAFLEANRENIGLLRGGLQREYRGLPLDGMNDAPLFEILLPHLSAVRNTTKAMMAEAKKLESEGRIGEALDDYVDTLASGAQISQGPTLIENLVGIAMQGLGSQTLLDSMAGPTGAQLDYSELAQRLEQSYQPTRPTSETMQFERAGVLDFVQRLYDYDPQTQQYKVASDAAVKLNEVMGMVSDGSSSGNAIGDFFQQAATLGTLASIGFEGMVGQVNEMYDGLTAAAQAPFQDGKVMFEQLDRRAEQLAAEKSNPVLAALLPSLSRVNQMATKAQVNRNATLLVANLNAYKQQNGTYPDSLDAFADRSFVQDPLSGQRFAYRRDGENFQLYSLGSDAVDNGGQHNQKSEREAGDLVYWPRPAKN